MVADFFNHFPDLAAALHDFAVESVKKAAFDAQAAAQGFIQGNDQIDTGNMLNSAYVVTHDSSTYPGSADTDLLPEVDRPDEAEAIMAMGASYSIYQNYGTRFLPARPFIEPAAAKVQASFEQAWEALGDEMARRVPGT